MTPTGNRSAGEVSADEAITAAELTRYLRVLTSDSLQGRDTPSPSLDRTAAYLMSEFQRLVRAASAGPDTASASRDTVWIQRYPVPGKAYINRSRTTVSFNTMLMRRGKTVVPETGPLGEINRGASINWDTAARPALDFINSPRLQSLRPPGVRLIAGEHTPQSVRDAGLDGSCVIYVPPAGLDSVRERLIVDALVAASRGVVIIADEDSLTFVRRLEATRQRPLRAVDGYMSDMSPGSWGAYAWLPAVQDVLRAADVDVAALRQAVEPVVARLPEFSLILNAGSDTTRWPAPTAPNVVAVLKGSDPKLKEEYIVFTAHLDTDREGQRDNAVGLAGLLALAKAFSPPAARPKRSVVFLATSGASQDRWGVRYFADRFGPAGDIVRHVKASLHLDALDQLRGDSFTIDGLRDFATESSPAWVGPAHPELGVTIRDGESVDRSGAHLGSAYLVRIRPSLVFHAAPESAPHGPPDFSPTADEARSRVLRLIFYLGSGLADTPQIEWSPEGRRQLRETQEGRVRNGRSK